jgi:hypothetical protein
MTREREEDLAYEDEDLDDPNDPAHPDWDLSESAPYFVDEPLAKPWFTRRWVLLIVGAVVISSLLLPVLTRL